MPLPNLRVIFASEKNKGAENRAFIPDKKLPISGA
jgi:hypothetical protein